MPIAQIPVTIEMVRAGVAIMNMSGALDPRRGSNIGVCRFAKGPEAPAEYVAADGDDVTVYMEVSVPGFSDPLRVFFPTEICREAAMVATREVLVKGSIPTTVKAVQVLGGRVDQLIVAVTEADDLIDALAAALSPTAPTA